MINYVKINNGKLYAHKNGLTISMDKDLVWKPSKLDYVAIVFSNRTDYKELEETEVEDSLGKDVVDDAKKMFTKLENLLKNKR